MKVDADPWMASVFGYDVFRVARGDRHVGRAAPPRTRGRARLLRQGGDGPGRSGAGAATLGFGVVDVNVTFERAARSRRGRTHRWVATPCRRIGTACSTSPRTVCLPRSS
jgi:hypothetical protein